MLLCLKGSVHSTDLPRTDPLRPDRCWTDRCPAVQLWTRCGNYSCTKGAKQLKKWFCCHIRVNEFRCNFLYVLFLVSEISAICSATTDADPEETKQTDGLAETSGLSFLQTLSASQKMVRWLFCCNVWAVSYESTHDVVQKKLQLKSTWKHWVNKFFRWDQEGPF